MPEHYCSGCKTYSKEMYVFGDAYICGECVEKLPPFRNLADKLDKLKTKIKSLEVEIGRLRDE